MRQEFSVALADGAVLHGESVGPLDAPLTLVLLHGWTLDHHTWYRQVQELARRTTSPVRVVSYDTRGHGRSTSTGLATMTLGQLGDDLGEVLRQVAPRGPVVLAGHSMGGMTIMEYAHRHPDRFADQVAGLVFVATTAEGHTHTAYGLAQPVARLVRLCEVAGAGVLARCGTWRPHQNLLHPLRPTLRWLLFGDRHDPVDLDLATRAVGRATLRAIGGYRSSIGAQRRIATLTGLGGLPAAVLVGDRDRLTPPACADSIAQALPGTELTVCPGAGHMLMMERPEEVTCAVGMVLDRVAGAEPGTVTATRAR
ncbi:alpha/beta fold hydrolase [Micromonospora sp. LOL_023]|uniref:alpha/beta fold hydrolase n=1 Tax=Micromonospora sp. LOL_023 TaxID=3345418 RepID=UPI003A8383CD